MRQITLACLLFMVALVGCEPAKKGDNGSDKGGDKGGNSSLQGEIKINGSSTVEPIALAITKRFNEKFPKVEISVGKQGTGNGFKRFQDKETDISEASRPIKASEFKKLQDAGISFIELPVAYDGLTIVVNKQNTWIKQLTVAQLKKIFLADGAAKTWKDVDPSWPAETIKLSAPGTGSGTYDYFKEVVAIEKVDGKKVEKEFRKDMSLNENDHIIADTIKKDKNGIGYFGVAHYIANKDGLRAIPIVNPKDDKAYEPTSENIETNKYAPFSRPLFIYVNTEKMVRPEVETFVKFYLEEGAAAAKSVGYVQLPEEMSKRAMDVFNNAEDNLGTVYVTKEGKKRSGDLGSIYKKENRNK